MAFIMLHDDETDTTRLKACITIEETHNNFDLNDSPPSFTSMEETHNNFDLNDSPPSFTSGDEHESQSRTEDVESASYGEIPHISGPREKENGDEHPEPLLRDEVLGKVFESTRQAHEFYAAYAGSLGFSIRKGIVRRNNKGDIIGRKWVCSKEGFRAKKYLDNRDRKREPRSITRTGCKALFFVSLDRQSNCWVCTAFTDTHNHDLALVNHTMFLRSKRKVEDVELGAAISLHRVGVRPSQIHDYLVDVSGGYDQVGFMRGDLQNRLDRIRNCSYFNSDAETCLSYLQAKLELEPGSFFKHTLDSHNKLADLYWCDGGSRADYLCFGDVIAFDSTYRTNAYNKPLVLIIGLNHHRKTNVYGFALLSDETQYTYTWLLTTFLEAMDGKCPQTVITDGDRAMRNAIQTVFPHATHRLCSWHLARNAQTNVGDENFTRDFNEFMYSHMTEHDFDVRWVDLINKYGLHNHDWVSRMYEDRHMWAETFLRGHFLGGMRSTQRSESMNAYLNRYVHRKLRVFEFVLQMDRMLKRMRNDESRDDFESINGTPVLSTHLRQFEEHTSKIYTKNVFFLVRDQIDKEGLLVIDDRINGFGTKLYKVKQYMRGPKSWDVEYNEASKKVSCTCKHLQSKRIPCAHSFIVMKAENLRDIPANMILRRWTKNAKVVGEQGKVHTAHTKLEETARIGYLAVLCKNLLNYAINNFNSYNKVTNVIRNLILQLQKNELEGDDKQNGGVQTDIVADPEIVLTKGSRKNKGNGKTTVRRCTTCRKEGHTRCTCPVQRKAEVTYKKTQKGGIVLPGIQTYDLNYPAPSIRDNNCTKMNGAPIFFNNRKLLQ